MLLWPWFGASAPVTPVVGIVPTIFVEVELAGVGAGWTDLSAHVLRNPMITIRHGIDGSGPADLLAGSGHVLFSLLNAPAIASGGGGGGSTSYWPMLTLSRGGSGGGSSSTVTVGYYSLYHANKRAGWALGIRCRIRMQDPDTATIRTRFIGRIDAIDPAPGLYASRQVRVMVVGWMDEAARWTLTPEIGEQVGKRGDEILTAILAEMPRQPEATSFDVGSEAYPYALDISSNTKQSALAEFANLSMSEIGPIFVKADGTLRYESRHARMLTTTSAWTLTDTDLVGLSIPSTRDEILNAIRTTYHPKQVDPLPTSLVYDQTNPIFVGAGATKMLLGAFRDETTGDEIGATDIQAQIAGTDYLANTKDDESGAILTGSFSIAVTTGAAGARFSVTNSSGSDGYLTRNRLRGERVLDRGNIQKEARDTSSVTTYGEHVVDIDMVYQDNDDVAQGAANYLLSKYKDPLAQVRTITVIGKTTALLTQILTRDISDRLSISETVTGVNNSYFINGEVLTVMPSGHLMATYTLAPAQDPFSGLYWILGTSTLGTNTIPAPF